MSIEIGTCSGNSGNKKVLKNRTNVTMDKLKFLYTNANSLRGKMAELQDLVNQHGYDIIGIAETWIDKDILDTWRWL